MHCRIDNDRLVVDGRAARFVASPHVGGRTAPAAIILHDTASPLAIDGPVAWFRDPRSKVSAHLVIGRAGEIVQMVECDRAAWHAGQSCWQGRPNCNAWTIGIEIVNPGKLTRKGDRAIPWFGGPGWPLDELVEMSTAEHGHGWWLPYTREQIAAVDAIVRALVIAYPNITEVLGHYHVSPRRKVDPGPQFPMADMQAILARRAAPPPDDVRAVQQRLADLGYQPGAIDGIAGEMTGAALWRFQVNNRLPADGRLDAATRRALMSDAAKGPALAAREAATREDVAATSGTMQAAGAVKRTSEGLQVGNVIDALSSPAAQPAAAAPESAVDALDKLDGALGKVEAAKGVSGRLSGLVDWLMTPAGVKFAIISVALTVVWLGAHRIEWRRWRDYVTGKHS